VGGLTVQALMSELISPDYEAQIRQMHALRPWGEHGHVHARSVRILIQSIQAATILDYGCGLGTLRGSLPDFDVQEYDPGIAGKEKLPAPADLVICTDVLEHIEPDCIDAVLAHLCELTKKLCLATISTRPANALLPNGANAHLIVESAGWWLDKLMNQDWRVEVRSITETEVIVHLHKRA
jgi:2-polyprenyl-3-methyl-5-hydroxy-6-metoxy-1,4-benzoquinol methylase